MNFPNKILFAVLLTTLLTTINSQDYCVSEKVLNNANLIFTSRIQGVIGEDFNKTDNKSKCIQFSGFPNNTKVCGEMGLRYKLNLCDNQCGINTRFWLKYYSQNREIKYESIHPSVENEWNHWNNTICADFQYGVKLFTQQTAANMQLDRFVLFINPKDISDTQNGTKFIDLCEDENMKHANICHPDVQHFGWMVTAIIMIIVTVGSFILVISLSVTMPYSVWDKPKIQRMPVRR